MRCFECGKEMEKVTVNSQGSAEDVFKCSNENCGISYLFIRTNEVVWEENEKIKQELEEV